MNIKNLLILFLLIFIASCNNSYKVKIYQGHNDSKIYTEYKCKNISSKYLNDCINTNTKRKADRVLLPVSKLVEIQKISND